MSSETVPKMSSREAAGQLSRDTVIERALAIADAEGLDAVSIRRLGLEFGVTPMALYWHVQNKDELLAAMGDRLYAGVVLSAPADAPWIERLRDLQGALLSALRRHPALLPLAFPRVTQCADGLALTETALQILHDGGFSVREAANIAAHALRTAIGLVQNEPGTRDGVTEPDHEEIMRMKRGQLLSLPGELYPRIIEATDDLLDCADQDSYDLLGIDMFVAGVQALAARAAQSRV